MTNNIHFIELPADATHDAARYSIMTTDPFPTTDDAARALMTSTMLAMIPQLANDAARLANNDFSDDDTDYMPAIANAYAALTAATATADTDPLESLNYLLHSTDFIDDMLCLSANYPIPLDIDYAD